MKHHFQKVQSSQIHSWAYLSGAERPLAVRFNCAKCKGSGGLKEGGISSRVINCHMCKGRGHQGVYFYEGVPPEIWKALGEAESKGAALNMHVKKGGYKFHYVPDGEEAA